jgi:hypothetical protein
MPAAGESGARASSPVTSRVQVVHCLVRLR